MARSWLGRTGVTVLVMAAACTPAWADRLSQDVLSQYGGVWSPDCTNPSLPRLRVVADGLIVERGDKRLMGRDPQASFSFFGNSPPRGFDVALLSQVRGGSEMMFMVYRDGRGRFIQIEAGPKTAAALGTELLAIRYRACQGSSAAQAAAPPTAPASPASRKSETPASSPDSVVASQAFRSAWRQALDADARESWLARMDGPAPAPRWVDIAGDRYVLNAFCKAHDCHDNSAVAIYQPDTGKAMGLVQRSGRNVLVGGPSAPVAKELQRLWMAEWRQGGK